MDDKRTEFKELLDKTIVKNYDSVNSYENQIQNLRSFVHNIIPEKLYRYRKYNQDTIKDLKTFIIRPSSPQFFNDPYVCQIFIDKNEIFEKIQNANFKYYISNFCLGKFILLTKTKNGDIITLICFILVKKENQYG